VTAYGVPLEDSVEYTFLYRAETSVSIQGTETEPKISIGFEDHHQFNLQTGATVSFSNQLPVPVTIQFEHPDQVTGGDITLAPNGSTSRSFPVAGAQKWTLTVGTITDTATLTIGDPE
jgi:hypothetical protein